MYAGHFAAALAMKAKEPGLKTWPLLLGVGLLDVLFGLFVLLGWERVALTPGVAPGFRLELIDWSHSLAMSLLWSVLFALLFVRRSARLAAWAGAAVFSHWVLDLIMHPPDLALYPQALSHFGLGLWERWPRGWWFVELAFVLGCGGYYLVRARRSGSFGGRGGAAVVVVLVLHLSNSPWFSPLG